MQQGILLHSLLERGNGIYLMQDQYEVGSAVDFEAFKFAWQQVVQRHPALRSAFHGLEAGCSVRWSCAACRRLRN